MTAGDWGGYDCWHALLDEICNRRGDYDNAALASELCRRSGQGSKEDFEAAKKKLRNWRSGRRVPLRRNFLLLSRLLAVDGEPELQREWERLYAIAHRDAYPHRAPVPSPIPIEGSAGRWRWARGEALVGAMIFTIGLAAAGLAARTTDPGLPQVGYDALVRLPLGSTRLIHGEHGSCEGPPPSWQEMQPRIPASGLGVFNDGGLAAKMVNDCGRELTVRAVRFTALKSGIEELTLLDDYMRVEVFEMPDPAVGSKPARR